MDDGRALRLYRIKLGEKERGGGGCRAREIRRETGGGEGRRSYSNQKANTKACLAAPRGLRGQCTREVTCSSSNQLLLSASRVQHPWFLISSASFGRHIIREEERGKFTCSLVQRTDANFGCTVNHSRRAERGRGREGDNCVAVGESRLSFRSTVRELRPETACNCNFWGRGWEGAAPTKTCFPHRWY